MFEQAMVLTPQKGKRLWTMMTAATVQTTLIGLAILAPLVSPETLRGPQLLARIIFAPAPPPPPPAGPQLRQSAPPQHRVFQYREGRLFAPPEIPAKIARIEDAPLPPGEVLGPSGPGVPGGVENGIPNAVISDVVRRSVMPAVTAAPPPLAKAPERTAAPPQRIHQGGNVQEAKLINRVIPAYPPLARQARISGTVELMGVIGKDGTIQNLRVVTGHPLLVNAALDAVRQWTYRPTYLNGEPVEVIAPITVTFRLN